VEPKVIVVVETDGSTCLYVFKILSILLTGIVGRSQKLDIKPGFRSWQCG
jgi:hypothetical protein